MQEIFKWLLSQFQPLHIIVVCLTTLPLLIVFYPMIGPLESSEIIVIALVALAINLVLSKLIMTLFKADPKSNVSSDKTDS